MELFASSESSGVEKASQPFVGRWGRLVSQTNWEKGKIIAEWRETLLAAGAAPSDYADETWARLVGQVTPQHVGRLRRTYVRFHAQQDSYEGLYWSHFLAALEWNDAELWLEGAVQNDWSINDMRTQRWETLGSPAGEEPRAEQVTASDLDEDGATDGDSGTSAMAEVRNPGDDGRSEAADGPRHDGPDFGDEGAVAVEDGPAASVDVDTPTEFTGPNRPFEQLADLPSDLREAFESFKLAILHHKMKQWSDVAVDDVVAALRALEQLAAAPS